MKKVLSLCAGALLAVACSDSNNDMGGSPNADTGTDQQNTVVNAGPDTAVGSGATASSGMGTASAQGAGVNETRQLTNESAKPQHPPAR